MLVKMDLIDIESNALLKSQRLEGVMKVELDMVILEKMYRIFLFDVMVISTDNDPRGHKKLKKGFSQTLHGHNYVIYRNPSDSTSPKERFDFSNIKTVNTNFNIDRNIKMKTPPDAMVFIKMPSNKVVSTILPLYLIHFRMNYQCQVIPVAAYMRYIKSYPIVGTVVQTLEKKKGFTQRFQVSADIKGSVSGGFFGCEASLEVTTGFQYEGTVQSESTETWQQTLTQGSYIVYQNVLVYAYVVQVASTFVDEINIENPGINLRWVPSLNASVMFVPINRDDPFTLQYSEKTNEPIEYDTLIDHLYANPSKWMP
ncbi:hypothetical protein ACTFIU_001345 [Dictyostelium citrinum]